LLDISRTAFGESSAARRGTRGTRTEKWEATPEIYNVAARIKPDRMRVDFILESQTSKMLNTHAQEKWVGVSSCVLCVSQKSVQCSDVMADGCDGK
jgi:hypothetical protein